MPVNLDDVLSSQLGAAIARDANATARAAQIIETGAASFLNALDRVMLREYTEPSFAEAMAMKEAGGSADAQRMMALQAGSRVPEGTGGK